MLSDRRKRIKLLLLVLALLGLGLHYGATASQVAVAFNRCVEDPLAYDGFQVNLSLWTVRAIGSHGYVLYKVHRLAPIQGGTSGLEVGDVLSVTGHFDALQGVIVEDTRRAHPLRPLKIGLGAVTMVFLAVYPWMSKRRPSFWKDGTGA